MSRTVTLSQLRDKIRFQADLIGATVRHTEAQLTTLVNDAIQGFREAISNDGNTHYLVPYSGTLTAGATSPYSFGSLDLSAISPSIVRTYGLDVTVDGTVHTLDHRPFTERNIWAGPTTTGIPRHWAHYQTAKLCIQPAPAAAYAYTLWYLPVLADLSDDADTFDGVAGWDEWIVWDVVCKLLIRDQQGQAFGSAKLYRDDVWTRIKQQATRVSSAGGAIVGRDSLRGRIPDFLAGRGPAMAGGGPPASHSITLAMLAEQTGPILLGVVTGTDDVAAIGMTTAAAMLPVFTPSAAGSVPASGGSGTDKFLRQDGSFAVPAGGAGAGSPGGLTGTIQIHGLSGFVGLTGFAIQGSPPSMIMRLPGSLRVTGGSVEVGSGTVKMSASGIDLAGGALQNVATLINFPTFAAGVPGLVPASDNDSDKFLNAAGGFAVPPGTAATPSGVSNAQLVQMPSGTVKARLTGTGAPEDVLIPTLMMHFPTFGSATPGLVPSSGGGTDNFLRADGMFAPPPGTAGNPGGADRALQFNENGSFGGMTGVHASPSGQGFRYGASPAGTGMHAIPHGGRFLYGRSSADDRDIPLLAWGTTPGAGTNGLTIGGSGLTGGIYSIATDHAWDFDGFTGDALKLALVNAEARLLLQGHVNARALVVASGISNANLHPMGSGLVKANLSGTGAPSDVSIATLLHYSPTFSSTRPGYVPPSGGGTDNFLRADGVFAQPPGTGSSPSGLTNAQLAPMNSGTVKMRVSGTGIPQDVPVPTLLSFFPTFSSALPGLVPPSGGGTTNYLRADGGFAAPSGAHQFPPSAGATNEQLAAVPSGTVKARLTAGVPQDLLIPTLAAFFPTFTANRAGLVAPGGGGTTNYLRADGAFAAPSGAAQFPPAAGVTNEQLAVMASGTVKANLSGNTVPANVLIPTLMMHFPTFTSARAGLFPASSLQVLGSGLDARSLHIVAKSIDTPSINGLPADHNQLKRGNNIFLASGLALYAPRGSASGGFNRYIVPSGAFATNMSVILFPSGAKGGTVIRIENLNTSGGNIDVKTPTGTILHRIPSGTKYAADFVFGKPSGTAFELGGAADLA